MTRTLYDRFLDSAARYPTNIAIEVAGYALTYDELRLAAERLSAAMVETLGRPPTTVGWLTSRSLAGYVGYLAAQRLGAVCVPLNAATPAGRNVGIGRDARLDLTVVDDSAGEGLAEYRRDAHGVLLDLTGDGIRRFVSPTRGYRVPPVVRRGPDDTAYIVFTSGTTGKPKGVVTTQSNVDAFLSEAIEIHQLRPDSRVSQAFELSFDGSVLEVWGAWGSGAALCVPQRADVFTPVRFVQTRKLTHWMSVPSLVSFATRLRALPAGSMPTLVGTMFGGEALTLEQARAWTAAAPNAYIRNGYGPTETTVTITAYEIPPGGTLPVTSNGTIPIGNVYASLDSVLLDAEMRPADEGELCVRGPQRFAGYLDPAENAGRFVAFDGVRADVYTGDAPLTKQLWYRTGDRVRRENGTLLHLGRFDLQVKVRGHRVELGEIEAVLRRRAGVAEVVVIPVRGDDGEIDLHAVYTGDAVGEGGFASLVDTLPPYMRPRRFHRHDDIPLTMVGKIDRPLLAERFTAPPR